jgi:hypothetical protein
MTLILCVGVEDIKTSALGKNYAIEKDGITISFTPAALDELFRDVRDIKNEQNKLLSESDK